MGLQLQFSSFQWIASIPPILLVFFYKIYIYRTYTPAFNFFNATDEEIRMAKVYSEGADHKSNRLERRFGHPALHMELFTPMLHKNMMPLLGQVYQGKINTDKARLDEYGGQQMEAQIVPGGIKIAAIDQVNYFAAMVGVAILTFCIQTDLEYDPVMYQRDRGELDWDRRSITSVAILSDGPQSNYPPSVISKNWAFDNYLANGPGAPSEIELGQYDPMQTPLLDGRSVGVNPDAMSSSRSLNSTPLPPNALQRNFPPSSLHLSADDLNQSPVNAHPSPSPIQHQRQLSGNPLAGQQMRSQSPGPYNSMMQYPPQPHSRQSSGNMLNTARSTSPGLYQAYSPQHSPQHSRQASGNMLMQGGRQSPGGYQPYSQPSPQTQHPSAGRQSPGPYQSYYGQQSQHTRQTSGNMLSNTPPPGYVSPPPGLHYHQQSMSSTHGSASRGTQGGD